MIQQVRTYSTNSRFEGQNPSTLTLKAGKTAIWSVYTGDGTGS